MLWNAPFLTCMGLPELPVVNYFSMMTVAEHVTLSLTAVKESDRGKWIFSRLRSYQPPTDSDAKRRQCLWWTISLLINTTNAGYKSIVKRRDNV